MAATTWQLDGPLRRAFAGSLGIHMLVALLLPTYIVQQAAGSEPIETLSFARIVHIRLQKPALARALPAAVPKTPRRAQVSFARVRTELSVRSRKPAVHETPQSGPRGAIAAAPKPVPQESSPLYARASQSTQTAAVPQQAEATATPAPESTLGDRVAAGSGTNDRGGVLPLGAEQNPALDPKVRTQLQRLGIRVTLIVTVGDDGRTKHVVFQPPLGATAERAIQTILASADWDAAVCGGGISCEGVATIRL